MSMLSFNGGLVALWRGRLAGVALGAVSAWGVWGAVGPVQAWAAEVVAPGSPAQFAQARSSGTAERLTLTAQLTTATLHAGRMVSAYAVAVVPSLGHAVYARQASGRWVAVSDTSAVPTVWTGTAGADALSVTLASNDNTTGVVGTRMYLGYGLGSGAAAFADMLAHQRYELVHTVGRALAPWSLEPVTEPQLLALLRQGQERDRYGLVGFPGNVTTGDVSVAPTAPNAGATVPAVPMSGTTLQENGVDEADLIKSDGQVVYSFAPQPVAQGATPTDGLTVAPQRFGTLLQRHRLSAAAPAALQEADSLNLSWSGDVSGTGLYLDTERQQVVAVGETGMDGGLYPMWFAPYAWSSGATEVVWVDVAHPERMSVRRSLRLQGQLIGSRRLGSTLYLVVRSLNPAAVDGAQTAAAWLPTLSVDGGIHQPLVRPDQCLAQTDNALPSASVITLVAVDLAAGGSTSTPAGTPPITQARCFVGGTEAFYMSERNLYLATTRHDYTHAGGMPRYAPRTSTDIHQFALDGLQISYKGSGNVIGHLGFDQNRKSFRMGEHNGHLRVITQTEPSLGVWAMAAAVDGVSAAGTTTAAAAVTEPPVTEIDSPGRLSILRLQGQALEQVGSLPNAQRPAALGKPGENLYASRFLGARGYLVTYRLIDPLYVLDLADPTDPKAVGELEVSGYSDYLFPLSESLLLGVGKDAVADGGAGDGRFAWYQGVKLSLIDVSDPSRPAEVARQVIGQRGTSATVLQDHHGIALQWRGQGATAAVRIGLPVSLHDGLLAGAQPASPSQWAHFTRTEMHRFEVNLGSKTLSTATPVPATVTGQRDIGRDRALLWQDQSHYYQQGVWTSSGW